jgi:hypothetical protein
MRPSGFPTEVLYSFLNSPIHIITPIHLTPFHFIILMTFGGENKVWDSCYFLLLRSRYSPQCPAFKPSVCARPLW